MYKLNRSQIKTKQIKRIMTSHFNNRKVDAVLKSFLVHEPSLKKTLISLQPRRGKDFLVPLESLSCHSLYK